MSLDYNTANTEEIEKNIAYIKDFLLQKAKYSNIPKNSTPIEIAACLGLDNYVDKLIMYGEDINIKGLNNTTLLHIAAGFGYTSLVNLLLKNNIKINEKNIKNETPLHMAVSKGNVDIVAILVEKIIQETPDALEDKTNKGWTPLYLAALCGHLDVFKLLEENGADLLTRALDNSTCFHAAASKMRTDILKYLCSKLDEDTLTVIDDKGNSAFSYLEENFQVASEYEKIIIHNLIRKNNLLRYFKASIIDDFEKPYRMSINNKYDRESSENNSNETQQLNNSTLIYSENATNSKDVINNFPENLIKLLTINTDDIKARQQVINKEELQIVTENNFQTDIKCRDNRLEQTSEINFISLNSPIKGLKEHKGKENNKKEGNRVLSKQVISTDSDLKKFLNCEPSNQLNTSLESKECNTKPLLNSKYDEAYVNKGIHLHHFLRREEVIEACNDAIKLDPNYVQAYIDKGVSLNYFEKYEEAIECFDKALELDSSNTQIYMEKGESLRYLKKYKKAIYCFNRAIKLDPNYAQAYLSKGILFNYLHDFGKAIKCFDKSVELESNYVLAYLNKAISLNYLQRYHEAVDLYNHVIKIDPKIKQAYFNKGFCLSSLNRYLEAIECYDKAIEISPNYYQAYYNKATSLACISKFEEAIKYYSTVIEICPNNKQAYFNKSLCFKFAGNYNGGKNLFDRKTELDSTYEKSYYNKRGLCNDEAIENFDRAIVLNPNCKQENHLHNLPRLRGEGVLISPRHVLTCAHNIYDHKFNCELLNKEIHLDVVKLYFLKNIKVVKALFPEEYKDNKYEDYAVLEVNKSIEQFGYLGIQPNFSIPDKINNYLYRYPQSKHVNYNYSIWGMEGKSNNNGIKNTKNNILNNNIFHTEEGQSGRSIWFKDSDLRSYIFAVNFSGSVILNRNNEVYINKVRMDNILKWIGNTSQNQISKIYKNLRISVNNSHDKNEKKNIPQDYIHKFEDLKYLKLSYNALELKSIEQLNN